MQERDREFALVVDKTTGRLGNARHASHRWVKVFSAGILRKERLPGSPLPVILEQQTYRHHLVGEFDRSTQK
jgi:hypothetical protein